MNNFREELNSTIKSSFKNDYRIENYDEYRFGKYPWELKTNTLTSKYLKQIVKNAIGHHTEEKLYLKKIDDLIENHLIGLNNIWNNISKKDKKLFVKLIAYKILGFRKVKLPRNNSAYWKAIEMAKTLSNPDDTYDSKFMHFILEKFDLSSIGYDIKLYFSEIGIAIDYIIEQYAYKIENKNIVSVEEGDTVLDVGGCWGDTALYFAEKSGKNGQVYSFEFIPGNIKLFKINTSFNPNLINRIKLIEQPVSDISGDTIYYKDHGPGSRVEFKPFEEQTGTSSTISIDDFVKTNNIEKVDFIKMDIEGAEPIALKGAIETIKKFKPKLAIAIYHSFDDFVNIPNWILSIDLGYEIFIDHYTIHTEETICFARIKSNN